MFDNMKASIRIKLGQIATTRRYADYIHITTPWFGLSTILYAIFSFIFIWALSQTMNLQSDNEFNAFFSRIAFQVAEIALVLYVALYWFNKTHIYVSKDAIQIRHKPFPWFGNKRIPVIVIKQVFCEEVVARHNNGGHSITYDVIAQRRKYDDIKLVSGLDILEQAQYIEREIESYLGIVESVV